MMKAARFVLKIVAVAMAAAAVACAVVAYWDQIVDFCYTVADRIEEKKADRKFAAEADDFADFDDCALM